MVVAVKGQITIPLVENPDTDINAKLKPGDFVAFSIDSNKETCMRILKGTLDREVPEIMAYVQVHSRRVSEQNMLCAVCGMPRRAPVQFAARY